MCNKNATKMQQKEVSFSLLIYRASEGFELFLATLLQQNCNGKLRVNSLLINRARDGFELFLATKYNKNQYNKYF
jgi:hypothetical protein